MINQQIVHFRFPGEPNGERFENCGVVWAEYSALNDEECTSASCSFCDLSKGPEMWLRGLPELTKFDSRLSSL